MAVIDDKKGVLVVRIVYDGPAFSGKTTSLRALARGVSSQMTTPAETAGRTLYFDWVDYVGGLFDGRQIRCQIISVPGQLDLAERRRCLLETADAMVLVLDTREHEWEFSLEWVKATVLRCRSKDPPVGLVLQANKRDAADAVPLPEIRAGLAGLPPVALVQSSATSGDGIREAFVLGVRMALDRVRALASVGKLGHGRPDDDTPEELLERLRSVENGAAEPVGGSYAEAAAEALENELDSSPATSEVQVVAKPAPLTAEFDLDEALFVPDPAMPGGMIWPPVDGRALLHEVASLDIRPARVGRTDWCGSGSGFRFHSLGQALFPDLQSARNQLIEWARLHVANTAHLSGGRAVILADAGRGRLRLWQIVRSEATLRERLAAALPLSDADQVARELIAVAAQLTAAREYFSSTTVTLPCNLWTVGGNGSSRPLFVGLMPAPDSHLHSEPDGQELLARELSPQLRELRRSRIDYAEIVTRVTTLASLTGQQSPAHWLSEIVAST
ncbi:MAG TPA: GTPase domain-containing protein [Polyangiaceae bacterium]|nr:GTPase domain-containing protein [Polyangiaceae bacterium]